MSDPFKITGPTCLSFSGGRTSAYMLWLTLQANTPEDIERWLVVLFENTGKEEEATLRFVRECGRRWACKIIWLEYRLGSQFEVVDFDTASRNGEPFRKLLEVKRDYRAIAKGEPAVLPNVAQRFCSAELKARSMQRWFELLFGVKYTTAIGIRADEPERVRKTMAYETRDRKYRLPLNDVGITEEDVLDFWGNEKFDLELRNDPELGTYEGNCVGCFLKKKSKIARLAQEQPKQIEWFARAEEEFGQTFRQDRPTYRQYLNGRIELATTNDEDDLVACSCTD